VTERTQAKQNKKLAMDWEAVRLRPSEMIRTTFWQKENSEGRISNESSIKDTCPVAF
jgi:hypothetical protein